MEQEEMQTAAEESAPGEGAMAEALAVSRDAERAAVEKLRLALLASEPAIEPSMVTGVTAAEVEATFAAAHAVVTRLREIVTRETAGRIPPGAPGRARSTARSPFEKIREGLAARD